MHDVLAFEDRGIPTVLLCTEPFMNSAHDHAEAFGNPDYTAVRVGHPLASLRPEQARDRADEAIVRVIEILTGQAKPEVDPTQERHCPPSPAGRGQDEGQR
jgi:hypothetical protein